MNDEDLVMLAQHNTLNLPWKCAVETPQGNIKVFCIEVEAEEERERERRDRTRRFHLFTKRTKRSKF